jgi:hypothetical protein
MNGSRWTASIGVMCAFLVSIAGGCATAQPDFERYFHGEGMGLENPDSPSHRDWMQLAAARYGCDTMAIRVGVRTVNDFAVGLPPCDIASRNPPEVIRAYKTAQGLREEWRFGAGARRTSVYFEGPNEKSLLSTFVKWW